MLLRQNPVYFVGNVSFGLKVPKICDINIYQNWAEIIVIDLSFLEPLCTQVERKIDAVSIKSEFPEAWMKSVSRLHPLFHYGRVTSGEKAYENASLPAHYSPKSTVSYLPCTHWTRVYQSSVPFTRGIKLLPMTDSLKPTIKL